MDVTAEEQPQEVAVRRFGRDGEELAIFEFNGALRERMISSLQTAYLTSGSYLSDARAVSPQGAMSLAVAGAATGATALSAAFSSTLFMATANPATLMTLGNGVGSAVMGAGGIVAQAPFIPIASILPTVAPILAVQALNTAVMMQQFKQMDRKLDSIRNALDTIMARIEATHAGELLAACQIVDDVYEQYKLEGVFSHDMLMRLAFAERDAGALSVRFRQLVDTNDVTLSDDVTDVRQSNYDADCAMLASFLGLRISYLRVCVDMQENPKSVGRSVERLKTVIDDGIVFWKSLQDRSRRFKADMDSLEKELTDMSWAERRTRRGLATEKELDKRRAAYAATMESERASMSEYLSLIESAKETRRALDNPKSTVDSPTLVAWKDDAGEHAFVTDQSLITV
ncbi:hypothetical protein [Pseudoclavibacter sp. 13-3]|uniref:hypothetical protein n=1 Tax=Pseudoclavibacter sp. 13-3 TaxID=2901228 RepID=UPI001E61474D|nr:hypothetical protein [Pseudoclavibacter sp. 13-3]MCD7100714.1 hypothetical protein [Pseudoclavibacter sp. 13-3]